MSRKKGGFSRGEQGASKTMRRLGAVLTFMAVSIIVVAAGYYVGQFVIERVFTDGLGPTPGTPVASQTSPADGTAASSDPEPHNVASERDAPAPALPDTTSAARQSAEQAAQKTTPPAEAAQGSEGVSSSDATTPGATGQQTPSVTSVDSGSNTEAPSTPPVTQAQPPAASTPTPPAATAQTGQGSKQLWHRVQVGNFKARSDAEAVLSRLRADYPDAYIVAGDVFRVQIGSFNSRAGADEAVATLRAAGYADVNIISVEL